MATLRRQEAQILRIEVMLRFESEGCSAEPQAPQTSTFRATIVTLSATTTPQYNHTLLNCARYVPGALVVLVAVDHATELERMRTVT